MVGMSSIHIRRCEQCGEIHDCEFYEEMMILCEKLEQEIDRLVFLVKKPNPEREIHELEDK